MFNLMARCLHCDTILRCALIVIACFGFFSITLEKTKAQGLNAPPKTIIPAPNYDWIAGRWILNETCQCPGWVEGHWKSNNLAGINGMTREQRIQARDHQLSTNMNRSPVGNRNSTLQNTNLSFAQNHTVVLQSEKQRLEKGIQDDLEQFRMKRARRIELANQMKAKSESQQAIRDRNRKEFARQQERLGQQDHNFKAQTDLERQQKLVNAQQAALERSRDEIDRRRELNRLNEGNRQQLNEHLRRQQAIQAQRQRAEVYRARTQRQLADQQRLSSQQRIRQSQQDERIRNFEQYARTKARRERQEQQNKNK